MVKFHTPSYKYNAFQDMDILQSDFWLSQDRLQTESIGWLKNHRSMCEYRHQNTSILFIISKQFYIAGIVLAENSHC